MLSFQRYLFSDTLRTLLVIIATLCVLSLLAQGLTYTEIIQENQQSILLYLKIVTLGSTKVLGLLFPLALFVSCVWCLNRLQRDAEILVVQATGMTYWQLASPFFRLTTFVVLFHLGLNLWAQPAAQRELRETIDEARTNLVTALIRPGEFTVSGDLTFFARARSGDDIYGVFISDATAKDDVVDYVANSGRFVIVDQKPALLLQQVQIHQRDDFGELSFLDLEQYRYDLTPYIREETDTLLKPPDRFLPELIWVDEQNYYEARARDEFTAEIHARLTSPLLSFAMVLLALWAVLGADYDKLGYVRRIMHASTFAVLLIILHILAASESKNDPALNLVQWLLPLGTSIALAERYFNGRKSYVRKALTFIRMPRLKRAAS